MTNYFASDDCFCRLFFTDEYSYGHFFKIMSDQGKRFMFS